MSTLPLKEINYIHLKQVGSTNQWVKDNIDQLDSGKLNCIFADSQTKGRGTKGRPWISPEGNVYCSLAFISEKEPLELLILLAKCTADLFGLEVRGKNDLFLNNKKIGGILAEVCSPFIILGLGLNINLEESFLNNIDQPATSFFIETGIKNSPSNITKTIAKSLLDKLKN